MDTQTSSTLNTSIHKMLHGGYKSPELARKQLSKEYITAQCSRKSRRAKSSEPPPLMSEMNDEEAIKNCTEVCDRDGVDENKVVSITKLQEVMSKPELISCYRLLMGEKLRLERFLSIMTKSNEMARNRLESDLLDAMMCIEDLKQALELRMARRSKIDPREAEERRYLIRQNKKLLNQLYESAKKIEKLELTKVEMKEQLELLDFQILEVENQKAMMEEELRKLPPSTYASVQTECRDSIDSEEIVQLQQQLSSLKSDLCQQKAENAAAWAKHQHLDNLVRELRRDNVELRDQLAKVDDAENSLAESDKPLARDTRMLQTQLDTQVELIRELQSKLKVSRDYTDELESQLRAMEPKTNNETLGDVAQAAVGRAHGDHSGLRIPRVDDLLLQETIRTFHALLAERDQEVAQLKTYIRHNQPLQDTDEADSIVLPDLFDTTTQTDPAEIEYDAISTVLGKVTLSTEQREQLITEIKQILDAVAGLEGGECTDSTEVTFPNVMHALQRARNYLRQNEDSDLHRKVSSDLAPNPVNGLSSQTSSGILSNNKIESVKEGSRIQDTRFQADGPFPTGEHGKHEAIRMKMLMDRPSSAPTASSSEANHRRYPRSPEHFSHQLQELKELGDLESVRAQLAIAEKRCQDLDGRITDAHKELARVRAEGRSTEASLSAARRTEAALRRRLLVAMDAQGSGAPSSRQSTGAAIDGSAGSRGPVELEAELLKTEAINTSLAEAAQLDRTRLQEQEFYIAQLEAERRSLHDRIATIQASETGAQRGIVRLQALYEDMLREYSESHHHDLTLRQRERSRSNYRSKDGTGQRARSQATVNQLQERITTLEDENNSLKRVLQSGEQNGRQPSGHCTTPSCNMIRQLLQAFQEKFSEVITQLCETQACLTKHGYKLPENGDSGILVQHGQHKCIGLVHSVRQQLVNLRSQLKVVDNLDGARSTLLSCSKTLEKLESWLQTYLDRTDTEMMQLRQFLLGVQSSDGESGQTVEAKCVDYTSKQPFSCSIRINKKPNMDLLSQKEQEILELRKQVRELESDIRTTAMNGIK